MVQVEVPYCMDWSETVAPATPVPSNLRSTARTVIVLPYSTLPATGPPVRTVAVGAIDSANVRSEPHCLVSSPPSVHRAMPPSLNSAT